MQRRATSRAWRTSPAAGSLENMQRMLPDGARGAHRARAWPRPAIFDWLQRAGNVADAEMHRVFNCGIGMVVVVAAARRRRAPSAAHAAGETAYRIGDVVAARQARRHRRRLATPSDAAPPWRFRASPSSSSGRGSNLAALLDADARRHARRHGRSGHQQPRAMRRRLPSRRRTASPASSIHTRLSRTRDAFDAALAAAIDATRPDLVVLAGFMRVLGAGVRRSLRGTHAQHPSVAAARRIPGLHTHRRALADGVRIHGCTVHFVTRGRRPRADRRAGRRAGARRRRRSVARRARARGRASAAAGGRAGILRRAGWSSREAASTLRTSRCRRHA